MPSMAQVYSTPVTSTTSPFLASETAGGEMQLAWDVLSNDVSWVSVEKKTDWHTRLGAHDVSALEFLMDEEIDELELLLTKIPFRRFKKFMGK
jgi:hypothetical protein